MKKLMRCQICGKYTLAQIHCGKPTISPHPISSGVEKNIKERVRMRVEKFEKREIEESA